MKYTTAFAAFVLVAGAGGVGYAPVAAAADPGPTVLVTGPGVHTDRLEVFGASSSGVVYNRASSGANGGWQGAQQILLPSAGEPRQLALEKDDAVAVAGPMAVAENYVTRKISYWNLLDGTAGTASLSDGAVDWEQRYLGPAPDGWLVTDEDDDGATHLYDVEAVTHVRTDLGVPPDNNHYVGWAVSDATGVVLSYDGPDGVTRATYLAYRRPGIFVPLDLADIQGSQMCTSITSSAVACVEFSAASGEQTLVRAPLDGGPATRVARSTRFRAVAVTDSATGWLDEDGSFVTIAAAGGERTVSPTPVGSLTSAGPAFVVATGGPEAGEELRTVMSAGDAGQLLVASALSPVASRAVGVGPGRVAWHDDSTQNMPVRSTPLDAGLPAGATRLVASNFIGRGIGVSGRRTAIFTSDPNDEQGASLDIATGAVVTSIVHDPNAEMNSAPPDLSGTRVLFGSVFGWRLYDLATGTVSTPAWLKNAGAADLWGNYVAYEGPGGSVWRRDLTSPNAATLIAPAQPVGVRVCGLAVYAWGDYVAWSVYTCSDEAERHEHGYRNARTLTPAVQLPAETTIDSLGSDGVVLKSTFDVGDGYGDGYRYIVRNPATGADTPIPGATGRVNGVVTDSGVAAWRSPTGVPTIAPLASHATDPPRFLGNAISNVSKPHPTSWSWSGEMVTSAAMTSCDVQLRAGATTVRTLACDPAMAAQGDAMVAWDGRNAAGTVLPPATYTWTLSASNADGPLRAANGSTGTVSGAIVVPAVKPTITAQPGAKTVSSGQTVVFTAAASGAPAPLAQWQVSANGGKTWASLSGQRSTRLSFRTGRAQSKWRYRAVFTNSAGSATTNAVTLVVR
ncbi:MAG: hypothetical protein QOH90_2156 [Actinomycetota bacterium]|jgi:hypothetical protein|nr:hypothetical protein [Actinomycetota bacterium]